MNVRLKILLSILLMTTITWILVSLGAVSLGREYSKEPYHGSLQGWKTNTEKRLIELEELISGGPGKDGIPAINRPRFIKPEKAEKWLKPAQPVISLVIDGQAKAYPLQILIWHEMVNDKIADVPVLITFCPLCYSANVFDRRVEGKKYTFGVSGMLRHSNMVMYDRQSQSLWQQVTAEALVGDMVGFKLSPIPAQIISFEQFVSAYKNGIILSRQTGYKRDYGKNPYIGYDDIRSKPFLYTGKKDKRLRPMEKVVVIEINNISRAYPYSITRKKRVINDQLGGEPIVIFHSKGAVSALDKQQISLSREDGSTGVFNRKLDGQVLTFSTTDTTFVDAQTASVWDITGKAISGPLKNKKLSPVVHGDYFAFVWLVFKPETQIYTELRLQQM